MHHPVDRLIHTMYFVTHVGQIDRYMNGWMDGWMAGTRNRVHQIGSIGQHTAPRVDAFPLRSSPLSIRESYL